MKKIVIPQDIDLYYKVFNAVASPIFIKDRYHRFVLVNDAFCEMFQIPRKDILGKTEKPFFPKHEWTIYREKDLKILNTGLVDENEEYASIQSGRRLRLITRKSLLTTSDGEKFILGTVTDITEKSEIAQKLRESELKYKTIFNLGTDPGGIFNHPEHIAIDVNQAFLKATHVTRKSVIGKTAAHTFAWTDPREREHYLDLLEKEHRVENMEIHLRPGKGQPRPYLISARMVKLNGEMSILYSLRDISGIRKAQELINETVTLYRSLVESSPNIILIHTGCHILFANRAFAEYTGIPEDNLKGRMLKEVFLNPATGNQKISVNRIFGRSVNNPEPSEFETLNREDVTKVFLLRSTLIRNQGKNVILSILTDITGSKNLDKLIISKINEAEENERKRFAADLHDDLGPILSSINLQLGLLQTTVNKREYIRIVDICNDLLNEVIGKISDISNNLVPRLLDDFGLEAAISFFCKKMEANGIFSINLNSNLDNRRFSAGIELHFYRIISELVNNSIKHSSGDSITVQLQYKKNLLTLVYRDNGKGYKFEEVHKMHGGIGITNILFRLRLINAEIDFLPAGEGNTELRIRKQFGQKENLPSKIA